MAEKINAFCEELDISLKDLIPGVDTKNLDETELKKIMATIETHQDVYVKAVKENSQSVSLFLFHKNFKYGRRFLFQRKLKSIKSDVDYKFIECFASVIEQELKVLSVPDFDGVIERSLRETRFRRAIAEFSAFDSQKVFRWVKAMEDSILLTYEQRPARHIIMTPKKIEKFRIEQKKACLFFKKPLPLEEGLINEKWIRSVVDGKKVALLSEETNKSANIIGIISLDNLESPSKKQEEALAAPHFSVVKLQTILEPKDVVMFAAPTGDLIIMMGKEVVFQKTQGFWRYHNYFNLHSKIIKYVKRIDVAKDLLRIVLDLSYERKGALFCISEAKRIPKIIDDPDSQKQGNKTLREAFIGFNISEWNVRRIISSVASTDGAVMLDENGEIHDVACVIGDLTTEESNNLTEEQKKDRDGLVGTRSLAAWRASRHGLAIKISEDGPITLFEDFVEVGKYG